LKVKTLYTDGKGSFQEQEWDKPEITADQIEVRAEMTGICRSDIDMMNGWFGPLPIHMQGHEGLATVTMVGSNITDVQVGDIVATRGEPAYAAYYNADAGTYVKVPELHPRYILEPVACGVNVVMQCIREIAERSGPGKKLLIVGSGFLSWVAYNVLKINHLEFEIDVLGSHNLDLWGDMLLMGTTDTYDVVIDLGGDDIYSRVNDSALIILGSGKAAGIRGSTLESLLWKAATIMFPSPRTPNFIKCMHLAKNWIEDGYLNVDSFWTKSYNRHTEWQMAFSEGVDRPLNYNRGFLYW
jgi:hypothetical protein